MLGIKIVMSCAALLLGVSVGNAQMAAVSDNPSTPAPVASGAYDPLTVWKTISLGTSYYTNPQRASSINVAYSFDGPEFSDASKSEQLWELATQGKVSFGLANKETSNKTITVIPFAELQKKYPVKGPRDLAAVLAQPDVTVVTGNKTLLGEASTSPVVKTDKPK